MGKNKNLERGLEKEWILSVIKTHHKTTMVKAVWYWLQKWEMQEEFPQTQANVYSMFKQGEEQGSGITGKSFGGKICGIFMSHYIKKKIHGAPGCFS